MDHSPEPFISKIDVKSLTQESRKALCEEWKSSGIKASAYCRQKGLSRPTFHGWCEQLGLNLKKKNADTNKSKHHKENDKNWVPLISKNDHPCESEDLKPVEMKFPNQMIIRLSLSMDDIQLLLKGLCNATTVIR